jgi:ribosomal protein S6
MELLNRQTVEPSNRFAVQRFSGLTIQRLKKMKRYEGLFILETSGKEEGIKEAIDKISAEITSAGGKVETVQKMDKRNFARVANKKHSSGQYVNVIFESEPSVLDQLKHRFAMNADVFRVMFTTAPAPKEIASKP